MVERAGPLGRPPAQRLALEHLTAPALSPLEIVRLAGTHGWAAATLLVSPFAAFPETAAVDLVTAPASRRLVREAACAGGVTVALAYPFVLTPRRGADALLPELEAAADIGAEAIGVLVYDRDEARAKEEFEALSKQAARCGLRTALEFFGGSAAPSLAAADALVTKVGAPGLGLCVDLLHLVRSGGRIEDLAEVRAPIIHAQICDAPRRPLTDVSTEAARGRLAPGEGELDVRGFVRQLPSDVWLGVETPPSLEDDGRVGRVVSIMHRASEALL